MEAGIPVIVLDRRLTGDKFTTFIGADNYLIGQGAGKWLVKHLNNKGKVVELQGMMSTDPAQKRHKGFQDAIKGSGLELVFTADMRWDQSQAKSEMESAMARAPQIDAVYAHNDPGAYGAFLAAQQAGRAQGITFVGIDALPSEGVAFVQQGSLAASFQYPTGGAEAIETALKILNGEKVEKEMVLSSKYFTKENAGQGGAPLSDVK
jgi:ribose transport system substrate-binding protein